MSKDLGLAEQATALAGVDAQMGMLERRLYADLSASDGANLDFSGIINMVRARSQE